MPTTHTHTSDSTSVFSSKFNKLKSLLQTKDSVNESSAQSYHANATPSTTKNSKETYRAWGVRWSGNADANHTALSPALQSCYTQNVNEQNNNQVMQEQNQQKINSQIEAKKGQRDGEKIKLESKQRDKARLIDNIANYNNKIDEIKSNDSTDIMAKVNFYIGAIIATLLAIYLFVFYSSASFSAFFGNNDIFDVGQLILDPHCYSEAIANGAGQLLFILLMPVIFLGLGFLIHQLGEANEGWSKYVKIGGLYIVTFIFDALLAFEISQKVFDSTVIIDGQYTVSMAFNSPSFWIVIFSGFVAYVIWGMVFDFTLQHFDNMNAHTKEISVLEKKIKETKHQIDSLDNEIDRIQLNINDLEAGIASLNTQLQNHTLIDKNILKNALSEFFSGWLAYMSLVAKTQEEKDQASQIYTLFISQI